MKMPDDVDIIILSREERFVWCVAVFVVVLLVLLASATICGCTFRTAAIDINSNVRLHNVDTLKPARHSSNTQYFMLRRMKLRYFPHISIWLVLIRSHRFMERLTSRPMARVAKRNTKTSCRKECSFSPSDDCNYKFIWNTWKRIPRSTWLRSRHHVLRRCKYIHMKKWEWETLRRLLLSLKSQHTSNNGRL